MTIKLIVGRQPRCGICRHPAQRWRWYVDLLADRHRAPLREESKFFGYTSRINLGGRGRPPAGPHYLYEPQR